MTDGNDKVRWLDADQQRIWRTYLMATSLLEVRLGEDLKPYDLGLAEYEVLVALSEAPDREVRMSELADTVHQSRSRLTHTVARMERDGLIERFADPRDRRGVRAHLTDKGFELLAEAAPAHVAAVRRFLVDAVDPEDYQALGRAMAAIEKATERP